MNRVPALSDLMPWGVAPLRIGRAWPLSPDAASLSARWDALLRAEGPAREQLFQASRSRSTHKAVAQLPGRHSGTTQLAREAGPCPEPLRILHGPYDAQWLIPDHRLIDAARPELWRVADEHQLFAVEYAHPESPAVIASALLPDGHSAAGRPGRIRPLFRRPGGAEPNLAPGLSDYLARQLGRKAVDAEDFLAWTLATGRAGPQGCEVPLTPDRQAWDTGVELGHRILELQLRGARGAARPRLPGGRRPYVRAPIPDRPTALVYEPEEEQLRIGEGGLISPVPPAAWDFSAGGHRVLELWFARRTASAEPGTLEAIRPRRWPQQWTSELLELITVTALLGELPEPPAYEEEITAEDLRQAGVLPAPAPARRPASVLDHHEEGPEGQFALI